MISFALVAASTVALPVLAHGVFGEQVLEPLAKARDWLQANHAAVMAVVFLVLGVVLLGKGIGGLG